MLRTPYKVGTYLVIALGVIHILFTTVAYSGFSINAMWFFAAGLAMVFAGFLNIAFIRQGKKDVVVWILTVLANLSCLLLFICAFFLMPALQVYVGVVLFACETAFAFKSGRALST
jgi:fatty acid desaturase